MLKWIHHLLNPHCPDCIEERKCKSCESLAYQLEQANFENKQLIQALISSHAPVPVGREEIRTPEPVTGPISWKVRKQMLEAEDRRAAQLLRKHNEEVDELEKEVGIGQLEKGS